MRYYCTGCARANSLCPTNQYKGNLETVSCPESETHETSLLGDVDNFFTVLLNFIKQLQVINKCFRKMHFYYLSFALRQVGFNILY